MTASSLDFYLSKTKTLGSDASLLTSKKIDALAARTKAAVKLDARIPASLPDGTYDLITTASELGRSHRDPVSDNNTKVFDTPITIR